MHTLLSHVDCLELVQHVILEKRSAILNVHTHCGVNTLCMRIIAVLFCTVFRYVSYEIEGLQNQFIS